MDYSLADIQDARECSRWSNRWILMEKSDVMYSVSNANRQYSGEFYRESQGQFWVSVYRYRRLKDNAETFTINTSGASKDMRIFNGVYKSFLLDSELMTKRNFEETVIQITGRSLRISTYLTIESLI